MDAAIDIVHAALRATWEELGQDHHEDYIDRDEVAILTKYLVENGAKF
jgi:hypothetical protein